MNIIVTGAHPDDPESGCGGFALKLIEQGHRLVFLYLSSGIPGKTVMGRREDEVREAEARVACEMCGAEPHFIRFPMMGIPFHTESVDRLCDLILDMDADLLLAHWPTDTHPDHQAAGAMCTQAAISVQNVALAYFEVCTGAQSLAFQPNRFVDISDLAYRKKQLVDCHVSQDIGVWWPYHEAMHKARYVEGIRCGFGPIGDAEAYHLVVSTPAAAELFRNEGCNGDAQARLRRRSESPEWLGTLR